jgi:hypothetical protein
VKSILHKTSYLGSEQFLWRQEIDPPLSHQPLARASATRSGVVAALRGLVVVLVVTAAAVVAVGVGERGGDEFVGLS